MAPLFRQTSPRWWRSATAGLLLTMATAVCVLQLLDAMFVLLEEGAGGAQGKELLRSVWRELPGRLRKMLPSAMLLGAVWHLGERAQHGELNALRTLGVSSLRLCLGAAVPALLMAAALLAATEYLASGRPQNVELSDWSLHGDRVFYSTGCGKELQWWQPGKEQLHSWGRARSACFEGDRWQMQQVRLWSPDAPEQRLDEYSLPSNRAAMVGVRPGVGTLSVSDLWRAQAFLPESRYRQSVVLESWRRLLAPGQIALMILLAAMLPLGMLRDPRPGSRLVLALMLALGFRTAETLLLTIGQGLSMPSLVTALIPSAVLLLVSWPLLRRIN